MFMEISGIDLFDLRGRFRAEIRKNVYENAVSASKLAPFSYARALKLHRFVDIGL